MVVGLLKIELFLQGSTSLKEKRQIIKSITSRVQNKFNVAICEGDHQDLWQRATIGIACICTTGKGAEKVLTNIENFIEKLNITQITKSKTEFFQMEHE